MMIVMKSPPSHIEPYLSIRIALRAVVAFLLVCIGDFSRLLALPSLRTEKQKYLTVHDEDVHESIDGN